MPLMRSRLVTLPMYFVGVIALAAAFSTARTFWGVFAAFYLWPQPHGITGLVAHSFIGALVGALPFGVLYGFVVSSRTTYCSALFASLSAGLLVGFVAWLGFLTGPTWWVTPLDAIFFVLLFSISASLVARAAPTSSSHVRILAATAFLLLAVFYHFGPQIYYAYYYAPKI